MRWLGRTSPKYAAVDFRRGKLGGYTGGCSLTAGLRVRGHRQECLCYLGAALRLLVQSLQFTVVLDFAHGA